ncbi:MAG: DUF4255 domain-containing protein [Gammaproteobacteria bacterium]|nr:DUF4255 domain-containing protein [Gammaproteobacteria bacterium]
MPVPVSSLSVAVQGIADFLDSQFGEEVNITVAHPQRASEIAKGAGATAHCLNLFAYRVAHSGFHADAGSDQTQFLRVHILLTPFPADLDNAADDADIRILGHAIRVLQSHPVLPITAQPLPGNAIPPPRTEYRLEAIMLAPTMEEINHIWTTQGGDLAYRLSAAYEFALIPIEPLSLRVEAEPPSTLIIDARVGGAGESGFIQASAVSHAFPVAGGPPPAAQWVPVQMLVSGNTLTNSLAIAAGVTAVTVAIAGLPGESAALQVTWRLDDDSESTQAVQLIPIASAVLDSADARASLDLNIPASAVAGTVHAQPAAAGAPIPGSPFGNVLNLTVN